MPYIRLARVNGAPPPIPIMRCADCKRASVTDAMGVTTINHLFDCPEIGGVCRWCHTTFRKLNSFHTYCRDHCGHEDMRVNDPNCAACRVQLKEDTIR